MSSLTLMGLALHQEFERAEIFALSVKDCEEMMRRVLARTAEAAERVQLQHETETT